MGGIREPISDGPRGQGLAELGFLGLKSWNGSSSHSEICWSLKTSLMNVQLSDVRLDHPEVRIPPVKHHIRVHHSDDEAVGDEEDTHGPLGGARLAHAPPHRGVYFRVMQCLAHESLI